MTERRTAWVAWVGIFVLYLAHSLPILRAALAESGQPPAGDVARVVLALLIPLALRPPARRWIWLPGAMVAALLLASGSAPRLDLTALVLFALAFENRWIPARKCADSGGAIVFFDGLCGLCNRFIDLLVRGDRQGSLRFAPLQGRTATERLQRSQSTEDPKTVILLEGNRVRERSDAAIRALSYLGGLWRLGEILLLLPRGLRDWVYDQVAKRRYQWFGKREICRIPSPTERARFLD